MCGAAAERLLVLVQIPATAYVTKPEAKGTTEDSSELHCNKQNFGGRTMLMTALQTVTACLPRLSQP